MSGAAVRLTGSGMGCPTWPTCEDGSLVPRGATGGHGWVEFVNRTFTGAVSVAVALAVLGSRRLQQRRRDLTLLSWGLVAGVFAQALLGGLVVLVDVAPVAVAGHYLLSAVLVANAVVLHHRAGAARGRAARPTATPSVLRLSTLLVAASRPSCSSPARWSPAAGPTAATRRPTASRSRCASVVPFHSAAVWALLVVAMVLLYRADRGDVGPEVARPRPPAARRHRRAGRARLRAVLHRRARGPGRRCTCSGRRWCGWPCCASTSALHEGVPAPLDDAPAAGAVAVVG